MEMDSDALPVTKNAGGEDEPEMTNGGGANGASNGGAGNVFDIAMEEMNQEEGENDEEAKEDGDETKEDADETKEDEKKEDADETKEDGDEEGEKSSPSSLKTKAAMKEVVSTE